ncbi:LppM family (lipo)protein [Actinomyces howellii]|uniref:LppM domain-containing protein n=1 Tax=Actinomyces howellii TaxID=52771 RepID=A0A448HH09_9ACTO|nr:hypothetical protein [Actinomyces howellii]VEG28235.1 Uncharacterised protein [Actinomyces howellii]
MPILDRTPSAHHARSRALTAPLATLGAAGIALGASACTAHMDMTIDEAGTYDVVMVMRDTTGTVFTEQTNCEDYADPELVGASPGATVTSTPVGAAGDSAGLGCEVRVSGVTVPEADGAQTEGSLVVRDGDLYVVTIAPYLTDEATSQATAGATSDPGATPQSLTEVVDARVSVSFPGAVVEDGGGSVSGSTVTWADADLLAGGVSASGYASPQAGMNVWDRFAPWIIGAVVAAGAALGAAGWRRRAGRRRAHSTSAP